MSRELGALEVIYSTDVLCHTLLHDCYVLITNALEMREAGGGGHVSFSPLGHLMMVFCDAQGVCVCVCVYMKAYQYA